MRADVVRVKVQGFRYGMQIFGLSLALDQFGGARPPPARIRNEGRQMERMIGTLGIQLNKTRNAFLRHWGSWTSIDRK